MLEIGVQCHFEKARGFSRYNILEERSMLLTLQHSERPKLCSECNRVIKPHI